jgi:hypothetical protein
MNFMSDTKNGQSRCGVEPASDRNQAVWNETRSGGTGGELRGIASADWPLYGTVAAISFGIGIVNALSKAQEVAWRGGVYDIGTPLLWEMSSIVTIILVTPILFVAVRRMRHVSGWLLRTGLAMAAIIAFSTLHIAGMVGLRKLAMFLVGGSYDFHFSVATLIYEFRKDVITCLLIGGTLWLMDNRREAQQSRSSVTVAPADPPSAAHMVWLRDGSSRIRIEPRDILWISSAGNYVEYSLAGSRTHLVRATLAGEEARLMRFNIARVHRTRLVNLTRVIGLRAGPSGDFELILDTGQTIAGSRRYRDAVGSIQALGAGSASVPTEHDARP